VHRRQVYTLIDGERDYQDRLPANRTDGEPRTVGDYLTMLQHYLNEAQRQWVMNAGSQEALDVIRKIAGIAVHCMEDHGAPPRLVRPGVPAEIPAAFFRTPARPSVVMDGPKQKPFTKKAKAKKR